ncbi:MAG: hypothetical protein PHG82_02330 [Candidatus Gracilibacteria bacterium]|nr:hypothetical protein [Candidatus Gracilibacteria bacterium]
MDLDNSIGGGFIYQWLVSFYIYMLLKEEGYSINNFGKSPSDFIEFRKNILKFKDFCFKKFGNDFNVKLEIMLEGDGKCFEDINLLFENNSNLNDNLIFIQVKTKGSDKPITRNDGILKSINNFIKNINFNKDKLNNNFLFIIFLNNKLSSGLLDEIKNQHVDFYISIINYIIKENNIKKINKNINYPLNPLKSLGDNSLITKHLIIDLKDKNLADINLAKYIKYYKEDEIKKIYMLVKDLKIILDNLKIIKSIKDKLILDELKNFYGESFYKSYFNIHMKGPSKYKILKYDKEFNTYKKFLFTYFSSKDGGKFIHELDSISKGKFI